MFPSPSLNTSVGYGGSISGVWILWPIIRKFLQFFYFISVGFWKKLILKSISTRSSWSNNIGFEKNDPPYCCLQQMDFIIAKISGNDQSYICLTTNRTPPISFSLFVCRLWLNLSMFINFSSIHIILNCQCKFITN